MKAIRFVAVSALLALAACSKPSVTDKPADAAATPAKPPLVTVNGKALSEQLFEEYAKALARKPASELSAEDRAQIKENLVRVELIAQQAEKDGLAKDPDVATRLELSRLEVLQQSSAQKYLKDHTPTEAELRAEFEAQLASAPLVEYQARHILVSSEEVAQKIIQQLKSGNDFATLAKRLSSDKQSAAKGGDLGWFGPRDMDPQITNAVALLKKGEVTGTPVQTQYGWHVIKLEDTRDRPAPAFDDVKDRLTQIVVAKKFKALSDEMLKTAKIDPPLIAAPVAAPAAAAPVPNQVPAPPPAN
ncbi:MAG TPA: peptidylprolyl isomerase [Steroidobacteraceae bacterium]|jgi:peptidyl-prolyl cis-trans isomerase C|nr:peptidylprolyl isomerase [Steroidobacteraceae bacterium]